jgi:membrane fusion protein (multidrug efflux system)
MPTSTSNQPEQAATGAADHQPDEKHSKRPDEGRQQKPSALENPRVRVGLIAGGVLVLLGGVIWFIYYWTRGRYEQSTNDAYLQADMVNISPQVSGYVSEVLVQDNQRVTAGQLLVRIDDRQLRARLQQARAQVEQALASLGQTAAQIHQQEAQIVTARAQLEGAKVTARYAQEEVDRYEPLTARGAHSIEELAQKRQTRDQDSAQVRTQEGQLLSAERQLGVQRAQLESDRAQVEQARAQVAQAEVDLQNTAISSSTDGRIGDRTVRVGQYVQAGTRLMSVVPIQGLYLVANFKETQIGLMRIGQPARIQVDAVSSGELHGTVQSFSPGTGAQFAILPPQNATGNFTKIVQRVPVRIEIESGPQARKVLVPGLSVTVTVDTLGAKKEAQQVKEEARGEKERRKREQEAATRRDRQLPTSGAGQ